MNLRNRRWLLGGALLSVVVLTVSPALADASENPTPPEPSATAAVKNSDGSMTETPPEQAPATAPAPPAPAPAAPTAKLENISATCASIWIEVNAPKDTVDPHGVRLAVARELEVAVVESRDAAQCLARVVVEQEGSMEVHFQGPDGGSVWRAVRAPENHDEVPAVAALLLGNLARDQISGLLQGLAPKPPPTEPEPEPEPERQPEPEPEGNSTEPPPLQKSLIHLAVAYPLSFPKDPLEHRFLFDFSLFYSRVGAVDAFSLNLGVGQSERHADGVRVAGIAHLDHGSGTGISVSGLFALRGGDYEGLTADGLASVHRGSTWGLQVAGLGTYNEGPVTGLQAAGLFGVAEGHSTGLLVAGATHLHRGSLDGFQAAGGYAHTEGELRGSQLAPVNVAGDVMGSQVGLVNIGGRVTGLQLGLVNIADDIDGASVGLVTYSKKGRTQLVGWFDTVHPANLGVRFYTGPMYAMPTLSYRQHDGKQELSPGISIGGRVPLGPLFLDLDANASTPAAEQNFNEHYWDIRHRALLGYHVLDNLAVFAGGGVLAHIETQAGGQERTDPIFSAGVEVF